MEFCQSEKVGTLFSGHKEVPFRSHWQNRVGAGRDAASLSV